jgi:putative methylase
VRRAELERILDQVPAHPSPRPGLEQYRTPSAIAAELLWKADQEGALRDKNVLDLGSGTGVFTIGAAALGARLAHGVEVDLKAVELAKEAADKAGFGTKCWFVASRLQDWHADPAKFDTVIMNPPFGAQKENKHADRLFMERAAQAVRPKGTVWFLAQERTERFLEAFARELGARIERVAVWDYPLLATMEHHAKTHQAIRVGGYRLSWERQARAAST